VPVTYAYAPGDDRDGVTLRLSMPLAERVDVAQLEWAVPALREQRVAQLLERLPKTLRRALMPLPVAAREILQAVDPASGTFLAGMSEFVRRRFGVDIAVTAWAVQELPAHLRPRYEIVGKTGKPLVVGRELPQLRASLHGHEPAGLAHAWQTAAQRWERYGLKGWDFGDLPDRLVVSEAADLPVYGYPGLHSEHGEVNLRLFRKPEEAELATRLNLPRLGEKVLHRELGWVQKDLRALSRFGVLYATLGPVEELLETAFDHVRKYLLPEPLAKIQAAAAFAEYVDRARRALPGLVSPFMDRVGLALQRRQEALVCRRPFPAMRAEIDALLPPGFLAQVPFEQLVHLPRYLQAILVRAERAALNPLKDAEKVRRLQPYVEMARQLRTGATPTSAEHARFERFRWLVEEYKVSLFAQELGTAVPVSPKKLDEALADLRAARDASGRD
jgi:ATP-dependent helicase HrpA